MNDRFKSSLLGSLALAGFACGVVGIVAVRQAATNRVSTENLSGDSDTLSVDRRQAEPQRNRYRSEPKIDAEDNSASLGISNKIARFNSPGTSASERFEILRDLAGHPWVSIEDLEAMANSLPDGVRSTAFAMMSERFAEESPTAYFSALDSLPPGNSRIRTIQAGAFKLDVKNLSKLAEIVSKDADQEEIESMAAEIRLRRDDFDMTSSGFLKKISNSIAPGLRRSLVELSGAMSVGEKSDTADMSRSTYIGDNEVGAYYEGRLRALVESGDPRFVQELKFAELKPDVRVELLGTWARGVAAVGGLNQVLEKAGQLEGNDKSAFLEAASTALTERDSMATSVAISKLPPSPARDILVIELVKFLKSHGDVTSAEKWTQFLRKE